jgi:hypothetical protein
MHEINRVLEENAIAYSAVWERQRHRWDW